MQTPSVLPTQKSMVLEITRRKGHRHWARTCNDTTVLIDGSGYTVPAGFGFDGSSIPPVAFVSMATPFEWPWCYAGCIHDAMYEGRLLRTWPVERSVPCWFPPRPADVVYRETLRMCCAGTWSSWRCWAAVRAYSVLWGTRHGYMGYDAFKDLHPDGVEYV